MNKRRKINTRLLDMPDNILDLIAQFTGKPWKMRVNKRTLEIINSRLPYRCLKNIYLPLFDMGKLTFKLSYVLVVVSNLSLYTFGKYISCIFYNNPIIWINSTLVLPACETTYVFCHAPFGWKLITRFAKHPVKKNYLIKF